MSRTITTADLLDALPVGSVVGSALRGVPAAAIRGDLGWALTDQVGRYSSRAVLAALGAAVVLHDPSAPAPTPSMVPEAAVSAAARVMASLNEGKPQDDLTEYEVASWRDSTRAALTAALPYLTAAPSATREAVEAVLDRVMDEAAYDDGTTAHDTEKRLADALLARFNITPKEDR